MLLDVSIHKDQLVASWTDKNGDKQLSKRKFNTFERYIAASKEWQNCTLTTGKPGQIVNLPLYDNRPSIFETYDLLRTFPNYQEIMDLPCQPRTAAFDIETEIGEGFPTASKAEQRVTAISVVYDDFNVLVMGIYKMDDKELKEFESKVRAFTPETQQAKNIKYLYYANELNMLTDFCKLVAKIPILTGWNCLSFDWVYIASRLLNHYGNQGGEAILRLSSPTGQLRTTSIGKFQKVKTKFPEHSIIMDYMELAERDCVIMPIKESLGLNYIAKNSVGKGKIEYDGNLQQLLETNPGKYMYYNAIDSVLVMMISKRFQQIEIYCATSQITKSPLSKSLSKIVITEGLLYDYYKNHDLKIEYKENENTERAEGDVLVGAYVKEPVPGKHHFCACTDFASLYPSTIITTNISIENFICTLTDENEIEKYKKDPDYFVSVHNNLYKNDKDYAFKTIQQSLKNDRAKTKYLSKKLDATVMTDLAHAQENHLDMLDSNKYADEIQRFLLRELKITVVSPENWLAYDKKELKKIESELQIKISLLTATEQAIKLIMNSMYGGSSHPYFYWYSMTFPNDITGEAKNLILMMEKHLSTFLPENWHKLTELHKELGITLKKEYAD